MTDPIRLTDEPEYIIVQPGLDGVAWLGEVIDGEPSPIGKVSDILAAERALVEKVHSVREIHAPRTIHPFTEDGNLDESKVLATYCDECTPDHTVSIIEDGEWNEDWPFVVYPCQTVRLLAPADRTDER